MRSPLRLVAPAIVLTLVFTGPLGTPADATPTPTRLAGADVAATAVAVSRAGWADADRAVVVGVTAWPDALAASSLSSPVLYTASTSLTPTTGSELRRLSPREIVIVGGRDAISATTRDELRAIAPITEIGGADRYETAARISALASPSGDAILVSGESWADAATMSAYAAARHVPVFLTRRDRVPIVPERLQRATRTVVAGGPDVVADSALAQVPSPFRIAGADRAATAAAVAGWSLANGMSPATAVIAGGGAPTDAVAAGVLAGARHSSPLLLASTGRLPLATQAYLNRVAASVGALVVVGRADAVSDAALDDAVMALRAAEVVDWVNGMRGNAGVSGVTRDGAQDEYALAQAEAMLSDRQLYHQPNRCATWGEDVGMGGDPRQVFDMWTKSDQHRQVIMLNGVRLAGTAVLTAPDGTRWVTLVVCG